MAKLVGIKETKEVLNLVPVALAAFEAAMKDGTVDWKDLLSDEVRKVLPAGIAAFQGAELIGAELKDLDEEEIKEILALLAKIVKQVMDLLK